MSPLRYLPVIPCHFSDVNVYEYTHAYKKYKHTTSHNFENNSELAEIPSVLESAYPVSLHERFHNW